jgi:hypothetical protein
MFNKIQPYKLEKSSFLYQVKIGFMDPIPCSQGRLEAGSTCAKNTGAEGASTVIKAPNAKWKDATREMNTVKFWIEPALHVHTLIFPHQGPLKFESCQIYQI